MLHDTAKQNQQGQYWVASETSCMMCADVALNPEGLNCDSEGTLLETLPLAEGYWRSTETSTVRTMVCRVVFVMFVIEE